MSDNLQKSRREVSVFQEFAERSGLPIVPNSIEKREPPEPDILCEVTGKGHVAFEIKEMCDEPIAKVVSALQKTKDDEPRFLWSGYAVQNIATKTRVRTHHSHQMTAAARAIAAMKFLMLRSKRVAIRRQSLRRQTCAR